MPTILKAGLWRLDKHLFKGELDLTRLIQTTVVLPPFLEFNSTTKSVWNNGQGGISSNTAYGENALASNTDGVENTAFGSGALQNNLGGGGNLGSFNTAVGIDALKNNTTGFANTGVGDGAMFSNTIASFNTAYGASALYYNQFGEQNVAIGSSALQNNVGVFGSNVNGHRSTAVGTSAMLNNTTGNGNAFGNAALRNQTTGVWNIGIGTQAGSGITTGNQNVILASTGFVGPGGGITTGDNNMILAPNNGNTTGITTGSGNIVIGKVTGLAAGATNTITIADGVGNIRQKFDTNGQPSFNALHTAPATATSTGTTGEFRFTSTGIFLCIATNTWVKANLATF